MPIEAVLENAPVFNAGDMPSVIPHGYKMVRADPTKMVNPVEHATGMFERNAKIEMANNLKKGSMEM